MFLLWIVREFLLLPGYHFWITSKWQVCLSLYIPPSWISSFITRIWSPDPPPPSQVSCSPTLEEEGSLLWQFECDFSHSIVEMTLVFSSFSFVIITLSFLVLYMCDLQWIVLCLCVLEKCVSRWSDSVLRYINRDERVMSWWVWQ